MVMRVEPLLVLVSGSASQHSDPLAFATTTKGLQFTSCSGLLLTAAETHNGVVLLPASVLLPWLQPGASWPTTLSCCNPPPLVPECGICAVGPVSAISGGAASCIPLATVQVPGTTRAAAQLLKGLNRDSVTSNWAFEWHVGGPSHTATEQGAFVLCWAQPSNDTKLSPAAVAGLPHSPLHSYDAASGPKTASSGNSGCSAAGHAAPGPLSNQQCLHLLQCLNAFLANAHSSGGGGALTPQSLDDSYSAGNTEGNGATTVPGPPRTAPGHLVSVVGSPFGSLAPFHFSNAHINGAIACAFPAPTIDTTAAVPRRLALPLPPLAAGRSAAAGGCGCRLGWALYALDAHVFPGMEGALVTPLQLPLASLMAAAPLLLPVAAAAELHSRAVSNAADWATSCSGAGGTHAGDWGAQPLAVLCTPVSRRADGVQIPLAVAWPHMAAALADVLEQLLQRAASGGTVAVAAGGQLRAAAGGARQRQQLLLQPVAARLSGSGTAGRSSQLRRGSTACCSGGCDIGTPSRMSGPGAAPGGGRGALWPTVGNSGRVAAIGGASSLLCADTCGSLWRAAAAGSPSAAPWGQATSGTATTAAAAAPVAASGFHRPGPAEGAGGLPPAALQAVVQLRCNGSWATGVLVEGRMGLLITTAHLFQHHPGSVGGGVAPQASGHAGKRAGGADTWADLPCWARVPWVNGGAGGSEAACGICGEAAPSRGPTYRWLRARVLYIWSNHLDLAVLKLEALYSGRYAHPLAAPPAVALAAVRETARARDEGTREVFPLRQPPGRERAAPAGYVDSVGGTCARDLASRFESPGQAPYGTYGAGSPVWAVGHSLVGPAAEWPALVSYGCVARVLRSRGGRPTMLVATTTTHAGGSGGALLDAGGRLVGLVTSNGRHAGGATLPNMAFCIAAEELEPVVRWAAAVAEADSAAGGGGLRCPAPGPGLAALEALDVEDEDAARIWRLQMPALEAPPAPAGIETGAATASTPPTASGRGLRSPAGGALAGSMSRL